MHRVGRYELICELWPTALGTRFAARSQSESESRRPVALQRISSRMPDRARGELQELGILATRLRHPRIGTLLDVLLTGDDKAIVSEYVHGVSLRSLMSLARLSRTLFATPVALRIALDLLEALDAVENCDVVMGGAVAALHGGVTPDAALVSIVGETLLADAALQGVIADATGAWRHPELLAYRAPEQLEPEPRATPRTDVYSTGVLLWEMLANRALFGASVTRARTVRPGAAPVAPHGWLADDVDAVHARQNVIERVQFAHVPQLLGVSPGLADLVHGALARDPAARPRGAAELIDALLALGEPVAAHAEVAGVVEHMVGQLLAARASVLSGA